MSLPNSISTRSMNYEDWKDARRKGLGGSDVAAILRLSKYKTPLDIYLEKIDEAPQYPDNPRMKAGRIMENVIAKYWADEYGYKIQRDNKIRIHATHPELIANIDRLIVGAGQQRPGVLEVKNTSSFAFKQWEDDGLPLDYYCQVQHYYSVTGYDWGFVGFLVDGWDLKSIPVPRDEEFIDNMVFQLLEFWHNHVAVKVPPEPTTVKDVTTLWPSISNNELALDIAGNETILKQHSRLVDVKENIKFLEAEKESLETEIKILMKNSTILKTGEKVLATWKQTKDKTVFNKELFAQENEELYKQYCDTVPGSRMFLVKK